LFVSWYVTCKLSGCFRRIRERSHDREESNMEAPRLATSSALRKKIKPIESPKPFTGCRSGNGNLCIGSKACTRTTVQSRGFLICRSKVLWIQSHQCRSRNRTVVLISNTLSTEYVQFVFGSRNTRDVNSLTRETSTSKHGAEATFSGRDHIHSSDSYAIIHYNRAG